MQNVEKGSQVQVHGEDAAVVTRRGRRGDTSFMSPTVALSLVADADKDT